jgi:hypothetical protein
MQNFVYLNFLGGYILTFCCNELCLPSFWVAVFYLYSLNYFRIIYSNEFWLKIEKEGMHTRCKLVIVWRPMRIQYFATFLKLRWQSGFMLQYVEFSLDVSVKIMYTDSAYLH